ncbi:hypothetical protein DRH29_04800 [candidate division Kazan bacterium]|uniref:Uncharacterized protein n=1 Tax=candidate division Kazan bacterium TaxID=2202143 RepID=A0A420ZBI0_UNCK3|nr:MAG: hypothetical protein DRH29_04800 [candidate division Kazan bacterium]
MKADLAKMAKCIYLIQSNRRISVRRLQHELGISKRSVYRWIDAVSRILPIELCNGIILNHAVSKSLKHHKTK